MWRFEDETIHVTNLQVQCIIGVRPFERENEQTLVLDLSFPGDFAAASDADELTATVDYSAVAKEARDYVRAERFRLLETLARRLGQHLCERFDLPRLTLSARKPQAINDSDGPSVSLTVVRDAP